MTLPVEVPATPPGTQGPKSGPWAGGAFSIFLSGLLKGDSAPDPRGASTKQIEDQERRCANSTGSLSWNWNLPLDDQKRARGGFACLTYSATTIDHLPPQTPVGYKPGMDRGHLIAREFTGSHYRENIVPMYPSVNRTEGMRPIERNIRSRLNRNERVYLAVIPHYYGEGTDLKYPVPYALNVTYNSASGYRNIWVQNSWN
jgi:hypothetical protein